MGAPKVLIAEQIKTDFLSSFEVTTIQIWSRPRTLSLSCALSSVTILSATRERKGCSAFVQNFSKHVDSPHGDFRAKSREISEVHVVQRREIVDSYFRRRY
jgi:hypothetical protein